MQKFSKRNTYTPTDAHQVCSSVTRPLNRDENLSEASLKTFENSSDGDSLHRRQEGLQPCVSALGMGRAISSCLFY